MLHFFANTIGISVLHCIYYLIRFLASIKSSKVFCVPEMHFRMRTMFSCWLLGFIIFLQIRQSHTQMETALGLMLRTRHCATVIYGMDTALIKVQTQTKN